ncbi:MAG: TetR/AcrR family transcriptional regulator [bacterium]
MTDSQETRSRILSCARDLYLEGGLQGVTMRGVAKCAEISATAIYRHFEDKEHLLMAVFEEGFRVFSSYMWESLGGESPGERFRSAGDAYLRFGLEQPHYYKVCFMAPAEELGYHELPENAREKFQKSFQFLVDRIREMMDSGVFREEDPELTAFTVWAHSHGLVALYIGGGARCASEEEFEELYWKSMEQVFEGLRPPG